MKRRLPLCARLRVRARDRAAHPHEQLEALGDHGLRAARQQQAPLEGVGVWGQRRRPGSVWARRGGACMGVWRSKLAAPIASVTWRTA